MANYERELESFRQEWNLPTYNLNRIAESVQALRFADSFLKGSSSDNSPATQYKKWFSRTLSIYFAANTMPNEDGKYMSSFDAQEFYDSFKNLVQAKYDADAEERGEVPLQVEDVTNGQKQSLENIIANCKRNYKKTLPALWYENLKNGTIDMQNLQNITSNSFDVMNKKWYVNENEMAGELTNIVAAREAMQQLRASRSGVWGWLWKVIFNRAQNRQEKEYLQQLDNQISALTEKGYQMDGITRNLTEKTVFGKDVNAKTETTRTQDKQVEQLQASPQENPVGNNVKAAEMNPVANEMENKLDDIPSEIFAELYREISGDKPSVNETQQEKKEREQRELNRSYSYKFVFQGMKGTITELNQQFDEAVANGADPKKEMQKVVHGIFKATVEKFAMNIEHSKLEKAEAFKNATRLIVNNFTAAAIYPNELSGAVNASIDQNAAVYEKIAVDGKEYGEEIENYKQMLEGDAVEGEDSEPVFDDEDNPFVESNANKSAPVNQQPQINAFSLDKK